MARPARTMAPPMPTTTPTTVLFVFADMVEEEEEDSFWASVAEFEDLAEDWVPVGDEEEVWPGAVVIRVVVTSLWEWLSDGVRVGVGVCVGVSDFEESLGVGVLDDAEGVELVDGVGVGVGVDEVLVVDVVDSEESVDAAAEGVELEAAPPNPPARPPNAEPIPESRSFFSTTSRRKGFELNQLACARATKTVIRVKTRNCCCRENILTMVLCVERTKNDGF